MFLQIIKVAVSRFNQLTADERQHILFFSSPTTVQSGSVKFSTKALSLPDSPTSVLGQRSTIAGSSTQVSGLPT